MTTSDGKLLDNEGFAQMIENLGDAYEAAEECYGMVQMLADALTLAPVSTPPPANRATWIEWARREYRHGLELGGTGSTEETGDEE